MNSENNPKKENSEKNDNIGLEQIDVNVNNSEEIERKKKVIYLEILSI